MTSQSTAVATAQPQRSGLSYASVEMNALGGGAMLLPKSFGEVVAFSEMMSRSDVAVPKHLRNNPGACMAVTMRALRWEMDPFAVASKTYLVNDQIAYEAQLVAAVVHTRAPIARRPDYTYEGEGETRQCIVSCEMLDGTIKDYTSPKKRDIKVQNSPLWKSDPDQQLGYFSIRSWGRRHTPEVLLGVYTPDELIDNRENMNAARRETTGMRARLEARQSGGQGFDADHVARETGQAQTAGEAAAEILGDDTVSDFDKPSEEVIDAEVEDISGTAADDFPGDKPAPDLGKTQAQEQTQAEPPRQETTDQPKPTLPERVAAFRKRMGEATNPTKLKSIRRAADNLFDDMERADPEGRVELAFEYEERLGILEEEERAERSKGGA